MEFSTLLFWLGIFLVCSVVMVWLLFTFNEAEYKKLTPEQIREIERDELKRNSINWWGESDDKSSDRR